MGGWVVGGWVRRGTLFKHLCCSLSMSNDKVDRHVWLNKKGFLNPKP